MRSNSLLAQVVAVLSRRTPAFQPAPGQPRTFGGMLGLVRRRRKPAVPLDSHGGDGSSEET
jgi:hypothetical protein